MRIVLYSKIVRQTSGLQTFEKIFIKKMSKFFDIVYVYDAGSPQVISEIAQLCPTIKNEGQVIRCDICLYSSLPQAQHSIQAKKYVQIVHAELSKWGLKPSQDAKIDKYVSVSEAVARDLLENFKIDSEVIPNLLEDRKPEKVLRFLTASRIDQQKGFDRMLIMAKALKEANRKFVWEVYGVGTTMMETMYKDLFKDIPEVVFMGERKNVQDYMQGVDYVVQLSDTEGFCYSIHEALQIEKPVIVTNWRGVDKVVENGLNGYILDMDMKNLDVNIFYEQFIGCGKLKVTNNVQLWKTLFNLLNN